MRLALLERLRGLDDFGHDIKVTYKGQETYQTLLGGFCTLLVKLLTLVLVISAA